MPLRQRPQGLGLGLSGRAGIGQVFADCNTRTRINTTAGLLPPLWPRLYAEPFGLGEKKQVAFCPSGALSACTSSPSPSPDLQRKTRYKVARAINRHKLRKIGEFLKPG